MGMGGKGEFCPGSVEFESLKEPACRKIQKLVMEMGLELKGVT